jgi:hypothetical protein
MKDRTTLNLNQSLPCLPCHRGLPKPQGMVCLLTLAVLFSSSLAIPGPLDNCVRNIEGRIQALSSSRALVVTHKIPTITYENAINGRIPKVKNTPYFEFEVPDGGFLTVIDLSSPKVKRNGTLTQALELWKEFTYQTYQRLPKFKDVTREEFDPFKFRDRTVVIMKTKKSLNDGDPEVLGGIRVVFAHGDEELPYQSDLPEFERGSDASAEPGRLTGSGFSPMMLHFSVGVIKQNPGITEVVVHTSKGHVVHYRRVGAKTKDVRVKDDDNMLLRFSRLQVLEVIKRTRDKLTLSAG